MKHLTCWGNQSIMPSVERACIYVKCFSVLAPPIKEVNTKNKKSPCTWYNTKLRQHQPEPQVGCFHDQNHEVCELLETHFKLLFLLLKNIHLTHSTVHPNTVSAATQLHFLYLVAGYGGNRLSLLFAFRCQCSRSRGQQKKVQFDCTVPCNARAVILFTSIVWCLPQVYCGVGNIVFISRLA